MSKEGMRIGYARNEFSCGGESIAYARVLDIPGADRLPVCLRVLLENVLRRAANEQQAQAAAQCIVDAGLAGEAGGEIEFMPARVLFQDTRSPVRNYAQPALPGAFSALDFGTVHSGAEVV